MLFFLIKKIEFQSIELSTCLDTVVSVLFFFEKSVSLDFFFFLLNQVFHLILHCSVGPVNSSRDPQVLY